jgi:hypothetical protein
MRFTVRLAPLVCLAAGCACAHKPYTDDPLLRGGRAVWRPHDAPAAAPAAAVPIEPPPPPQVVGAATSRQWE